MDLKELENSLAIKFRNQELLREALTHRSYLNENDDPNLRHNERMEFLGDAVLELVVTDFLYHRFPDSPEGNLTAYRSALVRTETISEAARDLNLEPYLLMSKGEAKDEGRARDYILANAFEAFLGALYIDQGYQATEAIIEEVIFPRVDEVIAKRLWKDAKSYVQEKAQEHYKITPEYELVSQTGPDHNKTFTVAIKFGERQVATGTGLSKQKAQQDAATKAIKSEDW